MDLQYHAHNNLNSVPGETAFRFVTLAISTLHSYVSVLYNVFIFTVYKHTNTAHKYHTHTQYSMNTQL